MHSLFWKVDVFNLEIQYLKEERDVAFLKECISEATAWQQILGCNLHQTRT